MIFLFFFFFICVFGVLQSLLLNHILSRALRFSEEEDDKCGNSAELFRFGRKSQHYVGTVSLKSAAAQRPLNTHFVSCSNKRKLERCLAASYFF